MISVHGLSAGYGEKQVLSSVDFEVAKGGFTGVLGPNACGKSTLLRVISGVLPYSAGRVRVGGVEVSETPARELAKLTATIPQSTEIPFPFTGEELVTMGRFPHVGRFAPLGEGDRIAIKAALEDTDTISLAKRLVTEVSGGERQRLVLARALAQGSPLMLMDEATAAMDVHRKIDTFDLLTEKNEGGLTVVAVMHDLNLAALYCKELLFMKAGEVFAHGPTEEVFTKETVEAVYETPVELFTHPSTGRPQLFFSKRRGR